MKRTALLLAFTLTAACSNLTETQSEVTSLGFLIFADGPTIDMTSRSPLTRYYLDAEGNDAGSWAGAASLRSRFTSGELRRRGTTAARTARTARTTSASCARATRST